MDLARFKNDGHESFRARVDRRNRALLRAHVDIETDVALVITREPRPPIKALELVEMQFADAPAAVTRVIFTAIYAGTAVVRLIGPPSASGEVVGDGEFFLSDSESAPDSRMKR